MTGLPDCPSCSAANTLRSVRAHEHGRIEAECSCCSTVVVVNAQKQIVWQSKRVETDVSGRITYGD